MTIRNGTSRRPTQKQLRYLDVLVSRDGGKAREVSLRLFARDVTLEISLGGGNGSAREYYRSLNAQQASDFIGELR